MAKQVIYRRGTTAEHATFTGANGEITVDTVKHVVVVHDGVTAGGVPLANASLVNSQISVLTANAANQANAISLLQSNAATQASLITALQSNAASQQASINAFTLASNATVIFANIAGVQANVTAANANIAVLFGNAVVQSEAIALANANIIALQSGLTAANTVISSFVAGTGFANINQLTANITAVNSAITTITTTFATNVAVAGLRANITAANARISSLQANIAAANLAIQNIALSPALINSVAAAVGNVYSGPALFGNISSNLVPIANVTYDLGSSDYRWRDLYLSGNTINLGGTVISTNGQGGLTIPGGINTGGSIVGITYGVALGNNGYIYGTVSPDGRTVSFSPAWTPGWALDPVLIGPNHSAYSPTQQIGTNATFTYSKTGAAIDAITLATGGSGYEDFQDTGVYFFAPNPTETFTITGLVDPLSFPDNSYLGEFLDLTYSQYHPIWTATTTIEGDIWEATYVLDQRDGGGYTYDVSRSSITCNGSTSVTALQLSRLANGGNGIYVHRSNFTELTLEPGQGFADEAIMFMLTVDKEWPIQSTIQPTISSSSTGVQGPTTIVGQTTITGNVTIAGNLIVTGDQVYQIIDVESTGAPYSFANANINYFDAYTYRYTISNDLPTALANVPPPWYSGNPPTSPLGYTLSGGTSGNISFGPTTGSRTYYWTEAQANVANANVWVTTTVVGQNPPGVNVYSTDPADWFQIPYRPVFATKRFGNLDYLPANTVVWNNTPPETISSAVDTLAASVSTLQLGNVAFTMANSQHWTSPVSTISDALNQLAERIYNIENP